MTGKHKDGPEPAAVIEHRAQMHSAGVSITVGRATFEHRAQMCSAGVSRLLGSAALALMLFTGCGDGRTPLLLYSPHGRDLLQLVEETFEAQNPQIDVRWLDMGSQEVYDRVRAEAANPQCDVWYGGPATILSRASRDGLLEPFRPSWADAVPAASHGAGDLYFPLYRTPPILVYNSDAVSAEEAPHDWDDLLDPRWQGEVLIRDPLASGTMRTVFGMVLARSVAETGDTASGFAWLRQLDTQTKEYVHNPALLHQKMVRQEGLVTIWELTDILFQRQRGAPLGYHFPSSGSPVIDDSVALVRGSRRAEVARTFIDWLGSREIQKLTAERAYRLPARQDIPADELPDWARQALSELVTADVDWELLEKQGAEWMNEWDRTVRSQGGKG